MYAGCLPFRLDIHGLLIFRWTDGMLKDAGITHAIRRINKMYEASAYIQKLT